MISIAITAIVTVIVAAATAAALVGFQILKSYILLCTFSSIVFHEIKYTFASSENSLLFHFVFYIVLFFLM